MVGRTYVRNRPISQRLASASRSFASIFFQKKVNLTVRTRKTVPKRPMESHSLRRCFTGSPKRAKPHADSLIQAQEYDIHATISGDTPTAEMGSSTPGEYLKFGGCSGQLLFLVRPFPYYFKRQLIALYNRYAFHQTFFFLSIACTSHPPIVRHLSI